MFSRYRGFFKTLAFILASFFFIEILSRFLTPIEEPYYLGKDGTVIQNDKTDDPVIMHRTKPNLDGRLISTDYDHPFKTDSLGFRGSNDYTADSDSTLSIMSFGDHFTVGRGVALQGTYTEVLRKKIENYTDVKVQAMNLGIGAFGTQQQVNLFKQFAHLNPDIIIMTFFARDVFSFMSKNDLLINYNYDRFLKRKVSEPDDAGKAAPRRKKTFASKLRSSLFDHCNLYRATRFYLNDFLRQRFTPPDDVKMKELAWQLTYDALVELDDLLEKSGRQCILLWIPFIDTIVKQDHSITRRIEGLGLQNIHLVDMLETLKVNPASYYYPIDNHWVPKAHEIAARLIFLKILEKQMLGNALVVK